MVRVTLPHWLLCGLLATALTACGNGVTPGNGGNGDGGNGNGDGGRYGNGDGGGYQIPDGGSPDTPIQACAASSTKAQKLPLDMYIMLDKSQSMSESVSGGTKWSTVTTALAQFLSQPLDGVSVGLQFFAITSGGQDSCNAADYANPAVEIAPLPGVGTAIATAITHNSPGSKTPTSAALQGGINHCTTWAGSHPGDAVILVMATDGDPTECDTNISDIEGIARTGATGTPKILTFVIGVGSSLSNLNGIAAAGGTTSAFLVDTGGNVQQQFLDALNTIRGTALGCVYRLPSPDDGGVADFNKVNVQYTPGSGGAPQTFPRVNSKADCPANGDAWYYDNPSAPTEIILCDSTCTKVTPDTTGEIDILLGCQTQTIG